MSNGKWRSDGVKSFHHYNLENIFQVKKEKKVVHFNKALKSIVKAQLIGRDAIYIQSLAYYC